MLWTNTHYHSMSTTQTAKARKTKASNRKQMTKSGPKPFQGQESASGITTPGTTGRPGGPAFLIDSLRVTKTYGKRPDGTGKWNTTSMEFFTNTGLVVVVRMPPSIAQWLNGALSSWGTSTHSRELNTMQIRSHESLDSMLDVGLIYDSTHLNTPR